MVLGPFAETKRPRRTGTKPRRKLEYKKRLDSRLRGKDEVETFACHRAGL